MDLRVEFIADWLSGEWTVTELADRNEISRKTAYKWIERYRSEGPAGLSDRSSAPLRHGRATAPELAAAIMALRRERPTWGPRKLIAKLQSRDPQAAWPSPSVAGDILKRAGLVPPRRKRWRTGPTYGRLTQAQAPNHVWAADYKGWVRLGDGRRCEPLTVSDSFSRFLIALEPCQGVGLAQARPVFERAFAEFGLPEVIRSDNGVPFAVPTLTGLTSLSIWWAKLGISHERIDPGRPQQNGRHERFHLTLKEAMHPPAADLAAQADRFVAFHRDYNTERPHEALGQVPPASRYTPSPRPLPRRLPEPDYPSEADVRRVRSNGEIKWGGRKMFLSEALVGEIVAIEETALGNVLVRFYDTPIAFIDLRQRRLRSLALLAREESQATENLSPSYPV